MTYFRLKQSKRWNVVCSACMSRVSMLRSYLRTEDRKEG